MDKEEWRSKDLSNYRLEALKLAYEVAFRSDVFNPRRTPEDRYKELTFVLQLADINLGYITDGKSLED